MEGTIAAATVYEAIRQACIIHPPITVVGYVFGAGRRGVKIVIVVWTKNTPGKHGRKRNEAAKTLEIQNAP